jgi:hypothetical protein
VTRTPITHLPSGTMLDPPSFEFAVAEHEARENAARDAERGAA